MIPSNPIPQVCNYGSSATYCTCPSDEQVANGVVPLDSLPAAWWNWMWSKTNTAINCARGAVGDIITEINNVLCNAGVCVSCACTDQLYQAIEQIRQTIGTASVAGAVKSSSTVSEVAINPTTGIMTVNCLGNAASLTTASKIVVGAINELKSTYDTCWSNNTTALSGKAPTSHAASATTYGVGNADCYGHLKISDTYTSVLAACTGVAASQKALACVYAVASAAAAGNISLGNSAGCALGTAAAGTATTAARSDHVHPLSVMLQLANCTRTMAGRWSSAGYTCLYSVCANGSSCCNNVRVSYADNAGSASSATSATNATNATNATYATNASLVKIQGDGTDDPDTGYPDTGMGIYKATNYNIGWASNDGMIMHMPWSTSYAFQIAVDDQSNWIAVRSKAPPAVGQPGAWSNWAQIITANNIGSQSVANAACANQINRYAYDSSYLFDVPLTNNCTCDVASYLFVSSACRLRYCNTTGVLYACCFCGWATNAEVAATASEANNSYIAEHLCSTNTAVAVSSSRYDFYCNCGTDGGNNWTISNIMVDTEKRWGSAELCNTTNISAGKDKCFALCINTAGLTNAPIFNPKLTYMGCCNIAGSETSAWLSVNQSDYSWLCFSVYNRNSSQAICCGKWLLEFRF